MDRWEWLGIERSSVVTNKHDALKPALGLEWFNFVTVQYVLMIIKVRNKTCHGFTVYGFGCGAGSRSAVIRDKQARRAHVKGSGDQKHLAETHKQYLCMLSHKRRRSPGWTFDLQRIGSVRRQLVRCFLCYALHATRHGEQHSPLFAVVMC